MNVFLVCFVIFKDFVFHCFFWISEQNVRVRLSGEKVLIEEFEKYRKNKIENFKYEHKSRLKDRFDATK